MQDTKFIALEARKSLITSIFHAKSGHPGGSLSCTDLLAVLFKETLLDQSPARLILSKGHACPALYSVAAEYGLIAKEELLTLRKINSRLQGHPHMKFFNWLSASTGSLGQGFSSAIGIALGFKYQNLNSRSIAIIGDGESQEGQIWEGAMFAAHNKLNNLIVYLDYNKLQSDDENKNIVGLEPLTSKWNSFNWNVIEIDGHDHKEINNSFKNSFSSTMPTLVISHTVKGKGISFMENVPFWHGSVTMNEEQLKESLLELFVEEKDILSYINGNIYKN